MFVLISTGVYIHVNNDSNNSILSNPSFNNTYYNLSSSFTNAEKDINESKENFENEEPLNFGDGITLKSILNVGKTATKIMIGTVNIIISFFQNTFKIPIAILSLIIAMVLITIVLYIWRLIRLGE